MRIFLGLLGIALSLLLIIYRIDVKRFTGNFQWAEEKLGQGGTYTVLLMAGIFGILFSITYMANGFAIFLDFIGIDFFSSVK